MKKSRYPGTIFPRGALLPRGRVMRVQVYQHEGKTWYGSVYFGGPHRVDSLYPAAYRIRILPRSYEEGRRRRDERLTADR